MREPAPGTPARKPPLDIELVAFLGASGEVPTTVLPEMISSIRPLVATMPEQVTADRRVVSSEHVVRRAERDAPDVAITVFERPDRRPDGPAVYYLHGGGMILGDRCFGLDPVIDWVEDLDVLFVSVEYRLAPEHPYPAPLADCYAGLLWLAANQPQFGYDPERLVIAGASAGGGLAAGVTLKVRDHGGPKLAAQMLMYPMLDDRNDTISSRQFDGAARWDRGSNDTGWDAYLGARRRTDQVEVYAAPARAMDLSGLPPTFIDVASAEVFRDEDVAYASKMWADGGICELHVWPGGFHAFDMAVPTAQLSVAMTQARTAWLMRTLDH
jgi:acetyl esterase/lipase